MAAPLIDSQAPPDTSTPSLAPRRATHSMAAVTLALGGLYLWRAMVAPRPVHPGAEPEATAWLGMDRWAFVARPWPWLFCLAAVAAGLVVARWPGACRRAAIRSGDQLVRPVVRAVVAVATVPMFWLLSTRQENLDGTMFQRKFEAGAASAAKAFVTHDEMLELYLHSRLWQLAHAAWGWDVAQTYRGVSCLAGGVAVFIGLGLIRRFPASRWPLVILGLFAGGWVLVFFGDVENYTLTNVLVLGYLVAGLRFLDEDDRGGGHEGEGERDRPLWPVGSLLGIAVLCHLEALVFAPSLLVLMHVGYQRGRRLDALVAGSAVPVLLGAALWWFDRHGLPISNLATHSQISGQGGHVGAFLAPTSPGYFWQQLQLLLLLVPAVALVPVLLTNAVRVRGRHPRFLGAATVGPLLLLGLWRAQLGAYEDWNLYAVAAAPLALLVVGALARQARLGRQAPWLAAALVLMTAQAGAWIIQHHIPPPG